MLCLCFIEAAFRFSPCECVSHWVSFSKNEIYTRQEERLLMMRILCSFFPGIKKQVFSFLGYKIFGCVFVVLERSIRKEMCLIRIGLKKHIVIERMFQEHEKRFVSISKIREK